MTTEEVKTRFVADVEKYKRDIQEAQKVLNKFVKTSDTSLNKREAAEYKLQTAIQKTAQEQYKSMNKASHSYKALGGDIAHVARNVMTLYYSVKSIGALFKTGVGFNVFMESQQAAFSVMMKSADGAKAKIEELYQFAVKSPLTFKETVASARQLLAYGYAPNELTENMRVLGTVAIAAGQSLGDIVYLQGTLRTQGRAYTRDLFQLANRGIPIYEELAKVMKVNQTAIKKMVEEGQVGYKEVEQAFKNMVEEGGRYAGMLEEYMKTFEGKYSMLKDIFEKLSGTITKSMTEALKGGIDALTEYFESDEAAQLGETLGETLGVISSKLIDIGVVIIKMLPALIKFVDLWIKFKLIKILGSTLSNMNKMFFDLSIKIGQATTAMAGFAGASATATFTSGIKSLITSLKALGAFLLTPQGAAIMAIGAAIGGIVLAGSYISDKIKESKELDAADPTSAFRKRMEQEKALYQMAKETAILNKQAIPDSYYKVEDIKGFADQFKVAEIEIRNILLELGLISQEVYNTGAVFTEEFGKRANQIKQAYENLKWIRQQTYLAEKTGESRTKYSGFAGAKSITTMAPLGESTEVFETAGTRAASDYLNAFNTELENQKLKLQKAYGELYDPEMMKPYIEDAAKTLKNLLEEGASIEGLYEETGWDEGIRSRLKELLELVEKEVKEEAPKLDKWFTLEWMVKSTEQAYDDLALQRDKDLDNAREKLLNEEISFKEYLDSKKYMWEKYWQDVDKMRREDTLKEYETMTQGNPKYWEDLKIKATESEGFKKAGYVAAAQLEGTEVGSMMDGADPMSQIVIAAAKFAMSIENVSKVLNPLTTIFEAMRPILEPLINKVLQPIVNILEMFGEIIAQMLTPFFGLFQIIQSLSYTIATILMIPLQMLGNAFSWLYDYVIVPFGNGIIDVLNGIIEGLNDWLGWLGVDIKELDGLKTTGELIKEFNEGLKKELTDSEKAFVNTFEAMADKLNEMVDKQIQSLQDLYEVGAISGAEYEARSKELDAQKIRIDEAQLGVALQQLTSMDSIKKWLIDNAKKFISLTEKPVDIGGKSYEPYNPFAGGPAGIPMSDADSDADIEAMDEAANIKAALKDSIEEFKKFNQDILSFGRGIRIHLASGTDRIPYDNFPANLHKDEGVIPGDFMSAVRSGELVLSGSKGGAGSTVNNYYSINVEGTVVTENELIEKVHKKTGTMLRRGYVS